VVDKSVPQRHCQVNNLNNNNQQLNNADSKIPSFLPLSAFFSPTESASETTPLMMNLPQSPIRAIHHTNGAMDDPVISSSPPPLLDPNEFPDDTDWDEISQASRQYSNPKIERAWNLLRQKVLSGEYLLEQQQQQQQRRNNNMLTQSNNDPRRQSTLSTLPWNTTSSWLQLSWSTDSQQQQQQQQHDNFKDSEQQSSLLSPSHSQDDNSSSYYYNSNNNPSTTFSGLSTSVSSNDDFNHNRSNNMMSTRTAMTESQRHLFRQRKQQAIRGLLDFSLGQCIAIMVLYMGLSVVAFSLILDTQWTLIDSMYFALVTCTTIGYGDLVPETMAGRVFTIVYALTGVCFLGIALGILGNHLVETQEAAVEQTSMVAKKRLLSLFSSAGGTDPKNNKQTIESGFRLPSMEGGAAFSTRRMSTMSALTTDERSSGRRRQSSFFQEVQEQDLFANDPKVLANAVPGVEAKNLQGLNDDQSSSSKTKKTATIISNLLFHFVLVMVLLAVFALLIGKDPGVEDEMDVDVASSLLIQAGASLRQFLDALYFSIVTATTVGYGDYAPVSQQGRLLTIFFIPLAVGAMGHFLSSVAEAIMDTRARTVRQNLAMQELSPDDLEIMDTDGDGVVTRAEFLEYMLVALNKVDKEFIEELRDHFKRLDVDGTGSLSKNDLIEQARRKLQRIHHKLDLCNYKQELLRKAAASRAQRRRSANLWVFERRTANLRAHGQNPMRSFARMVHQSTRNLSIFARGNSMGDYDSSSHHKRSQSIASTHGGDRRREPFQVSMPDRRRQPLHVSVPAGAFRDRNAFRDATSQLSDRSLSVNLEVSEEYRMSSSEDEYNQPSHHIQEVRGDGNPDISFLDAEQADAADFLSENNSFLLPL